MKMAFLGGISLASFLAGCHGETPETRDDANTTARAVCSAEQQVEAFQKMLQSPLLPARSLAGVDLTQGGTWRGLTLDDMEQTLCASTPRDIDDPELGLATWGLASASILDVEYDKATRRVRGWSMNPGYRGTITFKSRPRALADATRPNPFGEHTYAIGIGRPILRDGEPWTLRWDQSCTPTSTDACLQQQLTELFDAMMYTFAPELPSTQGNCVAEQKCLGSKTSGIGIFGARPIGTYLVIEDLAAAPSTPAYFYGFFRKNLPSSASDILLKLDDEGPVAIATGLGERATSCTMKLGQSFASFAQDCVQVMSDTAANEALRAKALGGATRAIAGVGGETRGTWRLDIEGVRPSFASERFDEREPTAGARATELVLDARAGNVKNDYAADTQTLTLAGSSAVYAEYARQVQSFLHAKMPADLPRFAIGAPECLRPANAPSTWAPALGCTGMEQIVLPGAPELVAAPALKALSAGPQRAARLGVRTVLKPGALDIAFCADPGTFAHCAGPDGSPNEFRGRLVDTMRHVQKVTGGIFGDEIVDVKVSARLFTKALVKYLRAAAQAPTDLSSPAFDALVPQDDEITVSEAGGVVTVRYLDRLELTMRGGTSEMTSIVFR